MTQLPAGESEEVKEKQKIIDIGYELPIRKLILVVDDEGSLQSVILDSLESEYRIISAYNGREGIEKARKTKPNLILMDMMMPDLGGYEAVHLLGNDPTTKFIPIIVMTAQNFDDSTVTLIKQEPNVVNFIGKPFKAKALREMIKAALFKPHKPS